MRFHYTARAAALGAACTAVFVAGMVGTASAATDVRCSNFAFQEDAQAYFIANPVDAADLDRNHNGVACQSLPHRPSVTPTSSVTTTSSTAPTTTTTTAPATTTTTSTSATTSATVTPTTSATPTASTTATATTTAATTDRLNCSDFANQAAAQAVLAADTSDPNRLDANHNGVACEDSFGTTTQQVAVFPNGAVQTGGTPLR